MVSFSDALSSPLHHLCSPSTLCPIRLAIQHLLLPLAVVSPISLPALATELSSHPSASFRQYLLSGFPEGFRVGFQPARIHQIHFTAGNMKSALNTPQVVEEYLACKVYLGRVAGPFASPPFPSFHVSSFGVIPKCGRPGKWRLIIDLLHPKGGSVNDGINGDDFSPLLCPGQRRHQFHHAGRPWNPPREDQHPRCLSPSRGSCGGSLPSLV